MQRNTMKSYLNFSILLFILKGDSKEFEVNEFLKLKLIEGYLNQRCSFKQEKIFEFLSLTFIQNYLFSLLKALFFNFKETIMKSLNTLVSYDRLSMLNACCILRKKKTKNNRKNKNEKICKNFSLDTAR
jgi:hypothetical protein